MLEGSEMITIDADRAAAVRLQRRVELDGSRDEIAVATFRGTAHGAYEAWIDGRPVSDAVLSPPWTSFEWRLEVQERDVTELLRRGGDVVVAIEVLLGNGWWRGDLGFAGLDANYGEAIGFIGELEIVFADGRRQRVPTDAVWEGWPSEVVANNLYDGQTIDARRRGVEDRRPAHHVAFDRETLVAQVGPDAARQATLAPEQLWISPSGTTLVDFGQNIVGWVRLRARGAAGSEVTVRHAEVLEHDELGTRPLRGARATDTYVLSGGDDELEPTLTFHGFRYAEVTGYPRPLVVDDLEAVVVHSTMSRTGWFECSNDLVNRLVESSVWGQRGNFLHVPTDCPQRDERLGWTGDIAVYAPAACFQHDCADLLHRWLLDLVNETRHAGHVPFVIPDPLKLRPDAPGFAFRDMAGPTAVWGDAAVWVPQALWDAYGDRDRLAAHHAGMVAHLESVVPRLSESGLWNRGFQFGDWLDPDAPPDQPWAAKAHRGVVATACLYRSASFVADAAATLGLDDEARWRDLAERTRIAFNDAYVHEDGTITSDCATVYALAIVFGLLDGDRRAAAGRRLAEVVADAGHRVSTGFAGTPYVVWALSETGHVDDAYALLLQTECPSWLYSVTMGATTIWERWDSMLPDGSINPGEMTSFNHYALGAVVDWLYKVVAGIRPAVPGYARLRLQPTPGRGLEWARATLDTRHGRVSCGWRRVPNGIEVTATVPHDVPAEVVLPDGSIRTLDAGDHVIECAVS